MNHQNQKTVQYNRKHVRFPNQSDRNLMLQKVVDTVLMFACCIGTISVMSAIVTIF